MNDKQQEIFGAVRSHLAERGVEEDTVTMEADLAGDLGLDSLDTVELTLALEQQFNIEIPDTELEDLATVADAVQLIEQKVAVAT
ncbi:MAG: acyl carrier protein [Actinomycetota bacterium]